MITGQYLLLAKRMLEDCDARDVRHLTDLGCHLAAAGLYSLRGAPRALKKNVSVTGCLAEEGDSVPAPVFKNLYDSVYAALEALPERERTDAVYLGELAAWGSAREALELAVSFLEVFRMVYYIAPHPEAEGGEPWHLIRQMESLETGYVAATKEAVLVRVEKKPAPLTVKLYVAAHKETSFPTDESYVPMWLGKPGTNKQGYFDDKQEPSIAYLNPRINECTGLYAIWKHADADIAGLVHYRRLFLSEEEIGGKRALIGREEILTLLARHDILVYPLECFAVPLAEQMITSGITKENTGRALQVFRRLITERQPAYADAFEAVMGGGAFFPCNMFIAKKELFDAYCEWLFSFLTDAARELDFDSFEDENKRTAGFLAERMLTVWLYRQSLRIKELEVTRIT